MSEKKDLTFRENKYVNSRDIKYSKEYKRSLFLAKISRIVAVVSIIFLMVPISYLLITNSLLVDGDFYSVDRSNTEYSVNDYVVFITDERSQPYDFVLYLIQMKPVLVGKVLTLPQGVFTSENGEMHVAKDGQHVVKCVMGDCPKDNLYLIDADAIYGKLKEASLEISH